MKYPDNMAIDKHGNRLPFSSDEVREVIARMIEEGDIIAAVFRTDDNIGIQIFGPPTHELVEVLRQAYVAYKNIMEGL